VRTLKFSRFLLVGALVGGVATAVYQYDDGPNGPIRPSATQSASVAPSPTPAATPPNGWQRFKINGLELKLPLDKNHPWQAEMVNKNTLTISNDGCRLTAKCVTITLYGALSSPAQFMAENRDCSDLSYSTTPAYVGTDVATLYTGKHCMGGDDLNMRAWVTAYEVLQVTYVKYSALKSTGVLEAIRTARRE
jgi:hypothetical protein